MKIGEEPDRLPAYPDEHLLPLVRTVVGAMGGLPFVSESLGNIMVGLVGTLTGTAYPTVPTTQYDKALLFAAEYYRTLGDCLEFAVKGNFEGAKKVQQSLQDMIDKLKSENEPPAVEAK